MGEVEAALKSYKYIVALWSSGGPSIILKFKDFNGIDMRLLLEIEPIL